MNARAKLWADCINYRDLSQRHVVEPFRLDMDIHRPSQSRDGDTTIYIQASPIELNISQ